MLGNLPSSCLTPGACEGFSGINVITYFDAVALLTANITGNDTYSPLASEVYNGTSIAGQMNAPEFEENFINAALNVFGAASLFLLLPSSATTGGASIQRAASSSER